MLSLYSQIYANLPDSLVIYVETIIPGKPGETLIFPEVALFYTRILQQLFERGLDGYMLS